MDTVLLDAVKLLFEQVISGFSGEGIDHLTEKWTKHEYNKADEEIRRYLNKHYPEYVYEKTDSYFAKKGIYAVNQVSLNESVLSQFIKLVIEDFFDKNRSFKIHEHNLTPDLQRAIRFTQESIFRQLTPEGKIHYNQHLHQIVLLMQHGEQIKTLLQSQSADSKEFLDALSKHCSTKIKLEKNSTVELQEIDPDLCPSICEGKIQFDTSDNQTALLRKMDEAMASALKTKERYDLLLIGEGGIGKTVTMLGTCQTLLHQNKYAIYIPLRFLNASGASLKKYIQREIFGDDDRLWKYYNSVLFNEEELGRWLFIFLDGLNELNSTVRNSIWDEVKELSLTTHAQLIISSRRTPEAVDLPDHIALHRLDMQRLSWEKVVKYLNAHDTAIPDRETMSEVLGIPLMLKIYIQVNKIHISKIHDMMWKEDMTNSTAILWNYLQCQIYQANSSVSNDTDYHLVDYVVAGEYLTPFLASRMEGAYMVQEKMAAKWLDEGLRLLPESTERLRTIIRNRGESLNVNLNGDSIFYILLHKLNLLIYNENGMVSFEHQEFQDTFHLIYLENSLQAPTEPIYKNALTSYLLPYDVLVLMGKTFSHETVLDLWEEIRAATLSGKSDYYGVYNLIELLKLKRNNDLSELDFSELDLRGINLQNSILKNPKNGKKVTFKNAYIGNNTFSSQGHSAAVTCADWSPTGGKLVSGSYDNTLKLWNAEKGECLATLEGHTHYVRCVSWSSGNVIASGGDDRILRIWTVESEQDYRWKQVPLVGHDAWIYAVAWSNDAAHLVSGDSSGKLILWNHIKDDQECSEYIQIPLPSLGDKVTCIVWSPTGDHPGLFASGARNGNLVFFDSLGNQLIQYNWPDRSIKALAWSPDGKRIAVATNQMIYILNTEHLLLPDMEASGEDSAEICFFPSKEKATVITSLSWFENILAVAEEQLIFLWDMKRILNKPINEKTIVVNEKDDCLGILSGHTDKVTRLAGFRFPQEKVIVSCSDDCTLRIWRAGSPAWNTAWNCSHILGGEPTPARCTAWSPDGALLATGYDDNLIRIWDVSNSRCVKTLYGHRNRIKCLAWSRNGKRIASGSNDGTVYIWNVEEGIDKIHCEIPMKQHRGAVNCIAWKDENCIISGSDDHVILIWDTKNHIFTTLTGHKDSVYCIALSADGNRLVSGSDDRNLLIWNLTNWKKERHLNPVSSWPAHDKPLRCVAWKPNSNMVISGANDHLLKRWNVKKRTTWNQNPVLSGHTDFVYCCAISPDGKMIASGSTDKTIRIWDAEQGKPLCVLDDHTGFVWNVAWSSCEYKRYLSSASSDGTVRIWEIDDYGDGQLVKVFSAFAETDIVDCNFTGAKFETDTLKAKIIMNGGIVSDA